MLVPVAEELMQFCRDRAVDRVPEGFDHVGNLPVHTFGELAKDVPLESWSGSLQLAGVLEALHDPVYRRLRRAL